MSGGLIIQAQPISEAGSSAQVFYPGLGPNTQESHAK